MHNKYEVISLIGEGSYGIVYKCRNKETNEIVAIKKFKDATDESINKSLYRELKFLRTLKHKNLVSFIESFKKSGSYYLVFEYMEKNLYEKLSENPMGVEASLIRHIVYQICKGLKYIHKSGYIHRDVKPENILIDKNNNVKLCDFGFTREVVKRKGGYFEFMTDYVATRWYRPPELLLGMTEYGCEVDFWGLGCIMGELVDGNPIFPGENDADQLCMINRHIVSYRERGFSEDQWNSIKAKNIDFNSFNSITADKKKYFNPLNNMDINLDISLDERYAGKLCKDGINFLKALLDPNPKSRLKGKEIFKHPYLFTYYDLFTKNKNTSSNTHNHKNVDNIEDKLNKSKLLFASNSTLNLNFHPININQSSTNVENSRSMPQKEKVKNIKSNNNNQGSTVKNNQNIQSDQSKPSPTIANPLPSNTNMTVKFSKQMQSNLKQFLENKKQIFKTSKIGSIDKSALIPNKLSNLGSKTESKTKLTVPRINRNLLNDNNVLGVNITYGNNNSKKKKNLQSTLINSKSTSYGLKINSSSNLNLYDTLNYDVTKNYYFSPPNKQSNFSFSPHKFDSIHTNTNMNNNTLYVKGSEKEIENMRTSINYNSNFKQTKSHLIRNNLRPLKLPMITK